MSLFIESPKCNSCHLLKVKNPPPKFYKFDADSVMFIESPKIWAYFLMFIEIPKTWIYFMMFIEG